MRVSIFSIFKAVVTLVLLVVLGVGLYVAYNQLPSFLEEFAGKPHKRDVVSGLPVIVKVPKGSTLSQVATILEEQGVISSGLVFKLVALIRGEQRRIQAGEYELKTGSDAGEVLDLLISGKTLMFSFTVPEGYNTFQTADLFVRAGIMPREEFLSLTVDKKFIRSLGIKADSLEGYLFPDTYFLRPSEKHDGKALIRRMVRRFQEVYDKDVRASADRLGWDVNKVVTLASLVEKEARESERGKVSAVFHNRLNRNMRLQCDPTVIYGIKPMGSKITYADLRRKHPYNTYVVKGLPPGPIASPGKSSLIAAVKPDPVNYLYFVATNQGNHDFSTTLREHNNKVNKYQRRGRKRSSARRR
jgi:UPF0755 protein